MNSGYITKVSCVFLLGCFVSAFVVAEDIYLGSNSEADTAEYLLSYPALNSNQITHEALIPLTDFQVHYNDDFDPAQFTATLNGEDITDMFHPFPGGFDAIDFESGRFRFGLNTLVLTTSATVPNSINNEILTDEDIFLIEVIDTNSQPLISVEIINP